MYLHLIFPAIPVIMFPSQEDVTYMERYRSGHNGADSKDSIPKVRTSANFSDCTRDPPGSNFQNFISFLRVVLLFSKNRKNPESLDFQGFPSLMFGGEDGIRTHVRLLAN